MFSESVIRLPHVYAGHFCMKVAGHKTKFGLHVQAREPHVEFGVLLSKGTQFPRSISITQRCENRQETQVSATIGHPEPHDLWGHRANIRHVLPLFILFPPWSFPHRFFLNLSEGQGPAQPFLLHRSRLSSPGLLTSSLLIQLFMEESCSFPLISSHQGTSSQHKLYHPLSCDSTSSRRTSTSHWAAQLNRNQQEGFTQLRTAQQQLLLPLFKDGKTSGLNDLLGY